MIIIQFEKWGTAISDFALKPWCEHIIEMCKIHKCFREQHTMLAHEHVWMSVSTSLAIHAIRAEINKGTIDHRDIGFDFNGVLLRPDEDGRMEHWPIGFCDAFDNVLCDLLEPRSQKK